MSLPRGDHFESLVHDGRTDPPTSAPTFVALPASRRTRHSVVCGENFHGMAAELLNQQLWCWGCDIKFPAGNLLMRHGFQRLARPRKLNLMTGRAPETGASIYRLEHTPSARILLRGFGIFHGDDRWGGIVLKRQQFYPWRTPSADLQRLRGVRRSGPHWSSPAVPRALSSACSCSI